MSIKIKRKGRWRKTPTKRPWRVDVICEVDEAKHLPWYLVRALGPKAFDITGQEVVLTTVGIPQHCGRSDLVMRVSALHAYGAAMELEMLGDLHTLTPEPFRPGGRVRQDHEPSGICIEYTVERLDCSDALLVTPVASVALKTPIGPAAS